METDRKAHWQGVYGAKGDEDVSWFQPRPAPSLDLIARAGIGPGASVIDIGGGASRLVDALLGEGIDDVTVLDLSQAALDRVRARIGSVPGVMLIEADVTHWMPPRRYDLWHDRAAFHFLTDAAERAAYVAALDAALAPGGHAIIATFAPDGPERCSGLPVQRYSPESLAAELGAGFALVDSVTETHVTPGGGAQRFQFSLLRRT